MIDKNKTGDNIRRLSIEKGVSLHKLSLIFGGGSLVYKWATGEMMPSINNLTRIYAIYATHTKAGDNAMMSIAKRLLLSGYSQKWRYRV